MALFLYRLNIVNHKDFFALVIIVFLISALGLILNIILGEVFIVSLGGTIQERGGMLRLQGFQLKPNDMALFFSFFLLYYVYEFYHKAKTLLFWLICCFCVVAIFLNGSRMALIVIPILLAMKSIDQRNIVLPILGTFFILIGVSTNMDIFEYYLLETARNLGEFSQIENSYYIRGIMMYYGIVLALIYFPIGTGAGTFGSVMSKNSPVYEQLGLSHLSFFQEMDGVYDSNVASILGELGVIGLFAFIVLSLLFYNAIKKLTTKRSNYLLCVFIYGWVLSITNPFFFYHYNAIIFSLFVMLSAKDNLSPNKNRWFSQ
jgi:hypothetical protein